MAELKTNIFTSWELTQGEHLAGSILSLAQKQCIQNLLSTAAEEKSLLTIDPKNMEAYLQAEASLKGQIQILTFILENSEACEEQLSSEYTHNMEDLSSTAGAGYDSPFYDEEFPEADI